MALLTTAGDPWAMALVLQFRGKAPVRGRSLKTSDPCGMHGVCDTVCMRLRPETGALPKYGRGNVNAHDDPDALADYGRESKPATLCEGVSGGTWCERSTRPEREQQRDRSTERASVSPECADHGGTGGNA